MQLKAGARRMALQVVAGLVVGIALELTAFGLFRPQQSTGTPSPTAVAGR